MTLRGVWRAGSGGQGREQAGQCWAIIKSESSVLWQGGDTVWIWGLQRCRF